MSAPASQSAVPAEIQTPRLLLQCWDAGDAEELLPILQANWHHLSPWIPARVATPAPVPELAERLRGYAANFAANKEWRYSIRESVNRQLLGEVALFPRFDTGRVSLPNADRAELGYWLRADANGRGLATEATAAVITVASGLEQFGHLEIRCDARNLRSAAVPARLHFVAAASEPEGTEVFILRRDGFPGAG